MARLGALLVVLSMFCFVSLVATPLAARALGEGTATGVAAGAFLLGEACFWVGVSLLGRDTWQLARRHGWRGVPSSLWALLRGRRPKAQ